MAETRQFDIELIEEVKLIPGSILESHVKFQCNFTILHMGLLTIHVEDFLNLTKNTVGLSNA